MSISSFREDRKDWKFNGVEELILKLGVEGKTKPTKYNGYPKYCFHNCQTLCLRYHHLIYVEGYCLVHKVGIPIEHAWLFDTRYDCFIDPTIKKYECTYLGVPLPNYFIKDTLKKRKESKGAPILFDYLNNRDLLKEGISHICIVN
ncbi:hypothetical protein H6G33_09605 [Calothrix sp. FACHB-1219]|uniref:hypothetical protein n=1 Tax=unclassified Calothrix TaxID=2619626 RepID=UPI0016884203|nr:MULTISPECIES: hypothetical protein [unclassified Calothrix]MBD2201602.1 hypothetical protein [Calothrix sp. FACHB-168]MBD2217288.1 hypothetical protein [Calothrix sp. FACHB-1219]